jgi:hypothetical protein
MLQLGTPTIRLLEKPNLKADVTGVKPLSAKSQSISG